MERAVLTLVCIVALATLTPCGAQPPGPLERWRSELELTEEQIMSIDEIQYASRVDEIARRAALERAELELDREMRKSAPDESKAMRLFDDVHKARGELERIHLRTRLKIRGILTQEQHQLLEDLMKHEEEPQEKPRPPQSPKRR